MKKRMIKTATVVTLLLLGFAGSVKAQQNNLIEEVRISNNEDFTQLRNIIQQNFDFGDEQLTEGTTNTVVKFEISATGKIENVHAESSCKYINRNLENALSDLQFRFKGQRERPYVYVLPVQIAIVSR